MPKKIERLQKEAISACIYRGHRMEEFSYVDYLYPKKTQRCGYSICANCGKQVIIIEYPRPNEIEISGEAVALGCTGE